MAPVKCRTIAQWLAGLAFTAVFIRAGMAFRAQFPNSYSWSEILINYRGGFVRRGLLGEIAFRLDGLVPARDSITIVVVLLYIAIAIWCLVLAGRGRDLLPGILFALSPATILFPVYDFFAFGRKDIFILAAFAAATLIVSRAPRASALVWLMLVYLVAGLIVESAWLYFPLAIALLTLRRGGDAPPAWHVAVWLSAGLYLLICLAATYLISAGHQQQDIVQSWQAIYPEAFRYDMSPVSWLGLSLGDGIAMTFAVISYPATAAGYVLAFCLANVPLILRLEETRRRPAARLARLAAAGAFGVLALSFLLGADWGRYIYLFAIHVFAFATLTREQAEASGERRLTAAAICLVLLYALTWQVKLFRSGGKSAFVPGAIFRFVPPGPSSPQPPAAQPP